MQLGPPLALSSLSLRPSWNCCHLSPRGPSASLGLTLCQQRLLLNQRRGPGCAGGDCLSPCSREELGESRVPAPPAWGHAGSGRLAARGQLGVLGVLEGPISPRGLGGVTGCSGDLQPSPGSDTAASCICHLVPHVPPSPWVPRGAHPRSPGTPAAVPSLCRALPRSAPLPWWAPVPHPAPIPPPIPLAPPAPRGSVTGASARLAACACLLPCSVSRRKKKQWKFSCIKRKKKNQTHM